MREVARSVVFPPLLVVTIGQLEQVVLLRCDLRLGHVPGGHAGDRRGRLQELAALHQASPL